MSLRSNPFLESVLRISQRPAQSQCHFPASYSLRPLTCPRFRSFQSPSPVPKIQKFQLQAFPDSHLDGEFAIDQKIQDHLTDELGHSQDEFSEEEIRQVYADIAEYTILLQERESPPTISVKLPSPILPKQFFGTPDHVKKLEKLWSQSTEARMESELVRLHACK